MADLFGQETRIIDTNRIGTNMVTDVWLTPPSILKVLGSFDLDPCSPENRPWDTAKQHGKDSDKNTKIRIYSRNPTTLRARLGRCKRI